jgi:hypothetical protein
MKERKVINDTYLHANSDYTEPSSMPQEVSQYLEFVNNLVFELEVQGGLAKVFMTMCKKQTCGPKA